MTARQPFPLLDQLPHVLHGVILDYLWDHARLHALTGLPEVAVPVRDLVWHLDLPFWAEGGRPFRVSPCEVASDRNRHPAQWARTMAADLRFPLHVRTNPSGKMIILDGVHRLLKAFILGLSTVNVLVLADADLDQIAILSSDQR